MTLPSSGPLALSQVAAEFGKAVPYSLTDFVRGGLWVPDNAANAAISTTPAGIALSQFYGAEADSSELADLVVGQYLFSGCSGVSYSYGYRDTTLGYHGAWTVVNPGSVTPSSLDGKLVHALYNVSGALYLDIQGDVPASFALSLQVGSVGPLTFASATRAVATSPSIYTQFYWVVSGVDSYFAGQAGNTLDVVLAF